MASARDLLMHWRLAVCWHRCKTTFYSLTLDEIAASDDIELQKYYELELHVAGGSKQRLGMYAA